MERIRERWGKFKYIRGVQGRDAAVCVLLNSDYRVLLIKRRYNLNDPWSGQISFPGGHFENSDVYLHITALRELKEETGIDGAEILGAMDVHHPRNFPEMNVFPFICVRNSFGMLIPQTEEVDYFLTPEIFELRVEKRNIVAGDFSSDEDCFVYGNNIIWGMTFRILRELMNSLKDH